MGRQHRGGGYGGGGSRGGGHHRGGWSGGRGGRGAWQQQWAPQTPQYAAPIDITGGVVPLGLGLGGQQLQVGLQGMQGIQGMQGLQGMQGASVMAPVMSPAVLGQPLSLQAFVLSLLNLFFLLL